MARKSVLRQGKLNKLQPSQAPFIGQEIDISLCRILLLGE